MLGREIRFLRAEFAQTGDACSMGSDRCDGSSLGPRPISTETKEMGLSGSVSPERSHAAAECCIVDCHSEEDMDFERTRLFHLTSSMNYRHELVEKSSSDDDDDVFRFAVDLAAQVALPTSYLEMERLKT